MTHHAVAGNVQENQLDEFASSPIFQLRDGDVYADFADEKSRLYSFYKFRRALVAQIIANTEYLNRVHTNVYTNSDTNIYVFSKGT